MRDVTEKANAEAAHILAEAEKSCEALSAEFDKNIAKVIELLGDEVIKG